MFDNISPDYDHLNHLMSMNVDKTWRRRALTYIVPDSGQLSVMDLACGTGDFSIAIARRMKENDVKGKIAFGIRNFEDKEAGLKEMLRVLKPGGRLVILELSVPSNKVLLWLYNLYFCHVLPFIGGRISGDKSAYKYLPASVLKFPKPKVFAATIKEAGFRNVITKAYTLGICRLFVAEK